MRLFRSARCFLCTSPQVKLFFVFAVVFCAAAQYFHVVSAADPSSFFFNARRAYQRRYSSIRIEQAKVLIASSGSSASPLKASQSPSICIGIATVQRDDARYFDLLVGSLLKGLSDAERNEIYLLPFIANTNPHAHYAYNESWLFNLADEVMTYENVTARDRARMHLQETPNGHKKKALFDYAAVLQRCLELKAPHIIMLEDDVIAADGWFRRTKAALEDLESRDEYLNSIYMRLFYNTKIQGWNSEFWPHYLLWSGVFEILLVYMLWLLRRSHASIARILSPRTTLVILFICSPACVALYFAAGRLTVHPNPTGIHQMNSYGCCSQALLFPRHQVSPLLNYFKKKGTGLRDELIEAYADERRLTRWALTPSVFQHIGSRSSKWRGNGTDVVDENGFISTERIWNFHFESWDAERLRREDHE